MQDKAEKVDTVVDVEKVVQSTTPTTLVDLNKFTVKQTHPYHEYIVLRNEYYNLRIENCVSADSKDRRYVAL